MNTRKLSRRSAIAQSGLLVGAAVVGQKFAGAQESATRKASQNPSARETHGPFRFCLNTATIRGQKLGIVKEIEVAANSRRIQTKAKRTVSFPGTRILR